jgi:hypothetical protein
MAVEASTEIRTDTRADIEEQIEEMVILSLEEAAGILGKSLDTLKRDLRAGRYQGEKDEDGIWARVLLKPVDIRRANKKKSAEEVGEGTAQETTADTGQEPDGTDRERQLMQQLLDQQSHEIGFLREQLLAKDRQISALNEEKSRADRLHMEALMRIPALPEPDSREESRGFFGLFKRKRR